VLLSVSHDEIARLSVRLGFTNVFSLSPGRDAKGERLLLEFWDRGRNSHCFVTVDAEGARVGPWLNSREAIIFEAQRLSFQSPPTLMGNDASVISAVPSEYYIKSVSGDWAVYATHNRPPWLAKIETPETALLELSESPSEINIWSDGQIVHLFTRRGLLHEEGPLQYRLYNFESGTPLLLKKLDLPRARLPEDMDPKAGLVVLQSNNRSLARSSLLNLNTGRTKFLRVWPSMVDFVFVKKETAKEWVKLTRP
jgi:hypothetical protein